MALDAFGISGSVRMEGGRELHEMLLDLDRKTRRKVLAKSMREGAKVILAASKTRAPVASGLVKKKQRVRAGRKRKGEDVVFKVQTGEGSYVGDAFYGSMVHDGWMKAPTIRLRNGQFISLNRKGKATRPSKGHNEKSRAAATAKGYQHHAGNPWMLEAFRAKAAEAVDVVRRELVIGILNVTRGGEG